MSGDEAERDVGSFRDHFSPVAAEYAASRPGYPDALFAFLEDCTAGHALAWDAGCGSGQASIGLAGHFERVVATDASAAQIANARPADRVVYAVAGETNPSLADGSVDLVTVAQAVHWFDRPRFFAEVARVLKPTGALAVWSYGLTTISPEIDAIVQHLYADILGDDWPPERRLVEARYEGIGFPYRLRDTPTLEMSAEWSCESLIAYLGTWSAVKAYRQRTGSDPLTMVRPTLLAAWPRGEARRISWPLTLLVGGPQR